MAKDKLGGFEQEVLAAVSALGEEAYGLAIYNKLFEFERDPNQGSMYVTLDRLERKGYLVSRFSLPEAKRGGMPRKYFRITPEGAEALLESVEMSKKVIKTVPKSLADLLKWPIRIPARYKK
jgi:PadR family transcriptional regulator PadR